MATEYVVQGFYPGYGWLDLTVHDELNDARDDHQAYVINEPEYAHRIVVRETNNV